MFWVRRLRSQCLDQPQRQLLATMTLMAFYEVLNPSFCRTARKSTLREAIAYLGKAVPKADHDRIFIAGSWRSAAILGLQHFRG
jgi:hypothetical protein